MLILTSSCDDYLLLPAASRLRDFAARARAGGRVPNSSAVQPPAERPGLQQRNRGQRLGDPESAASEQGLGVAGLSCRARSSNDAAGSQKYLHCKQRSCRSSSIISVVQKMFPGWSTWNVDAKSTKGVSVYVSIHKAA